jgi:hypothetical protein
MYPFSEYRNKLCYCKKMMILGNSDLRTSYLKLITREEHYLFNVMFKSGYHLSLHFLSFTTR